MKTSQSQAIHFSFENEGREEVINLDPMKECQKLCVPNKIIDESAAIFQKFLILYSMSQLITKISSTFQRLKKLEIFHTCS